MASLENFKTKTLIGNILYGIAIICLLYSIFQKGRGIENAQVELTGFIALFVAAVYGIWLSQAKKKAQENS